MTQLKFDTAGEAAMYAICIVDMVGRDCLEGIENMGDGTFTVHLKEPIDSATNLGIMLAISKDKAKNPEKYSNRPNNDDKESVPTEG